MDFSLFEGRRIGGLRSLLQRGVDRVLVVRHGSNLLLVGGEDDTVALGWGGLSGICCIKRVPHNLFMQELNLLHGNASVGEIKNLPCCTDPDCSFTFVSMCRQMGLDPGLVRRELRLRRGHRRRRT